jgi:hypothetical protein
MGELMLAKRSVGTWCFCLVESCAELTTWALPDGRPLERAEMWFHIVREPYDDGARQARRTASRMTCVL